MPAALPLPLRLIIDRLSSLHSALLANFYDSQPRPGPTHSSKLKLNAAMIQSVGKIPSGPALVQLALLVIKPSQANQASVMLRYAVLCYL